MAGKTGSLNASVGASLALFDKQNSQVNHLRESIGIDSKSIGKPKFPHRPSGSFHTGMT